MGAIITGVLCSSEYFGFEIHRHTGQPPLPPRDGSSSRHTAPRLGLPPISSCSSVRLHINIPVRVIFTFLPSLRAQAHAETCYQVLIIGLATYPKGYNGRATYGLHMCSSHLRGFHPRVHLPTQSILQVQVCNPQVCNLRTKVGSPTVRNLMCNVSNGYKSILQTQVCNLQ